MAQALHFDHDGFSEALRQPGVLVVDFWATWCMPCKMLGPVIEQLAGAYDGRAVVGKVDIDEQRALAEQYGIQSVPTVMVFKNGKAEETLVGVRPIDAFKNAIDRLL